MESYGVHLSPEFAYHYTTRGKEKCKVRDNINTMWTRFSDVLATDYQEYAIEVNLDSITVALNGEKRFVVEKTEKKTPEFFDKEMFLMLNFAYKIKLYTPDVILDEPNATYSIDYVRVSSKRL